MRSDYPNYPAPFTSSKARSSKSLFEYKDVKFTILTFRQKYICSITKSKIYLNTLVLHLMMFVHSFS